MQRRGVRVADEHEEGRVNDPGASPHRSPGAYSCCVASEPGVDHPRVRDEPRHALADVGTNRTDPLRRLPLRVGEVPIFAWQARDERAGQQGTTCCYAKADKFWVRDADGMPWEMYTLLADAEAETAADATLRRFLHQEGGAAPASCC